MRIGLYPLPDPRNKGEGELKDPRHKGGGVFGYWLQELALLVVVKVSPMKRRRSGESIDCR